MVILVNQLHIHTLNPMVNSGCVHRQLNLLMKAGGVYEAQGKYNDALEVYNIIKDKYGKTAEARDIDKYIARATLKSAK